MEYHYKDRAGQIAELYLKIMEDIRGKIIFPLTIRYSDSIQKKYEVPPLEKILLATKKIRGTYSSEVKRLKHPILSNCLSILETIFKKEENVKDFMKKWETMKSKRL